MNTRSFWWLAMAFTLLWIWMEWNSFQQAKSLPTPQAVETNIKATDSSVPMANQSLAPVNGSEVPSAGQSADIPAAKVQAVQGQRISVTTDLLNIIIDTQGGDIRDIQLLEYASTDDRDKPFQLMGDTGQRMYIAQNGIAMQGNSKLSGPTHNSVYQTQQTHYVMDGATLSIPMTWEENGIKVTKTYTFTKGDYQIAVDYKVENTTNEDWSGSLYSQLKRNTYDPEHNAMMYTYTGPVLYDGHAESKYIKHSFSDLDDTPINSQQTTGGWAAMIQHYFLAAIIPNQTTVNTLYAKPAGNTGEYVAGVVEPLVTVKAGATETLSTSLYIGPIIQDKLEEIAPGLELTVDYGILTLIANPIFWLLEFIYSFVGNWGWSIIVLTILIKLAFYKLSETSYRSMARLKKFSPKLKQLKENYGDDKAIYQQKMMKLYKEEKINPLGGCLPILVQMPVFIALYWVLLYSAEMRQAPWMLWIQDLSVRDPYFILPVIMGISMWI